MIVPDINVLIYAVDATSPSHDTTRAWWDGVLSSDVPVGLCMPVVAGFIRLTTHRRVFARPLSVDEAVRRVDEWIEQPYVELLTPSSEHWSVFQRLLVALQTGGNLTTDCEIAAYAIANHAEIATNDADFRRIPGVRLLDPTQ